MQARFGKETAVLGYVAVTLAVLVSCVGATRLSMDLSLWAEPSLGDHVAIAPASPAPPWAVKASLPSGAACEIGMGNAAAAGGELYVVMREAGGAIEAIWSSAGRSSTTGPDCGNGARLRLEGTAAASLASVSRSVLPLTSPEAPSVF